MKKVFLSTALLLGFAFTTLSPVAHASDKEVETIISQVGDTNSVVFDEQQVEVKNHLNADGKIVSDVIMKKEPFKLKGIIIKDDFIYVPELDEEPDIKITNEGYVNPTDALESDSLPFDDFLDIL